MIHQTLFKVFPFFLPLWSSSSRRGRKANPKWRKRKTWIQPKPQNIVDNAKYQIPNIPTQTLKYCRQNTARQYNHHLGELSNPNIDLGHHQLSEDSKESFTQVAPFPSSSSSSSWESAKSFLIQVPAHTVQPYLWLGTVVCLEGGLLVASWNIIDTINAHCRTNFPA